MPEEFRSHLHSDRSLKSRIRKPADMLIVGILFSVKRKNLQVCFDSVIGRFYNTYARARARTHTHTYIHTHIRTYTHTYTHIPPNETIFKQWPYVFRVLIQHSSQEISHGDPTVPRLANTFEGAFSNCLLVRLPKGILKRKRRSWNLPQIVLITTLLSYLNIINP